MKKFSIAVLFLACASASSSYAASSANPAAPRSCEFRANAPDQHKVVRGDTLWGISGKFLEHAWCWPQVWGLNREEIRNPHWIYPGQIVYFDRATGRLRLGKSVSQGDASTVHLSRQIRSREIGPDAIPSIPAQAIEPFLSQPLIIEENALKDAPRIVATDQDRVNVGKDDRLYVRGDLKTATAFQSFRLGKQLKDPVTQKVLGYECIYLGTVKLQRAARTSDEAHVFSVASIKQEMSIGDRLVPITPVPIINYVPHPPATPVEANVVSIYDGVQYAGQNQIVTINRGKNQNIDIGTVLELYRAGQTVLDKTESPAGSSKSQLVKLPEYAYGNVFIFRVFDDLSYGLIMQVSDTVQVGDAAKSPE